MELNLKRPICFFDLETTGIQVAKDRIVEISVLKIHPKGLQEKKTWLVNPEVPIPSDATAVHGITDEKVQHAPKFKEIAKDIYQWIKDADLAVLIQIDLIFLCWQKKCCVQGLILI